VANTFEAYTAVNKGKEFGGKSVIPVTTTALPVGVNTADPLCPNTKAPVSLQYPYIVLLAVGAESVPVDAVIGNWTFPIWQLPAVTDRTVEDVALATRPVEDEPPAPSATFAPLIRAVNSFAVESYQRSPFAGVDGSPAIEPTFNPGFVDPGLNVCFTSSGNVIAPEMAGVVIVGDVPNTKDPVPVSSVTVARIFADDGVVRNVSIPLPVDSATIVVPVER
jgi:hypothetical protein